MALRKLSTFACPSAKNTNVIYDERKAGSLKKTLKKARWEKDGVRKGTCGTRPYVQYVCVRSG